MVEKGAAVVKMWSNQEKPVRKQVKNLCEVVAYAMHSSGKTSLAVWLSPYKIAKIDALASKLAGRYFHYFAWLVAFTKSSQKNQHSPLDSANKTSYNVIRTKEES